MPINLYVPPLGAVVTLAEDWNFRLYFNSLNNGMLQAFCEKPCPENEQPKYWGRHEHAHEGSPLLRYEEPMTPTELAESYRTYRVTRAERKAYLDACLPKGAVLQVERIYIRKGKEAFNSITFKTGKIGEKKFQNRRFWVKLQDANKIVCNVVG